VLYGQENQEAFSEFTRQRLLKPASTTAATAQKATTSRSSEFNPDYSYVRKDLKRIGILASSFFVILIVLSFFLR